MKMKEVIHPSIYLLLPGSWQIHDIRTGWVGWTNAVLLLLPVHGNIQTGGWLHLQPVTTTRYPFILSPPLPPKVMMTTTIHTHPLPPFLDRLLLSHPHRTFLRSRIFRIFFPSIPPIDDSFIPAACTGRPRVNLVSSLQPSTLRQSSMHPGLVATGLLASRTGNTVTSSKMD